MTDFGKPGRDMIRSNEEAAAILQAHIDGPDFDQSGHPVPKDASRKALRQARARIAQLEALGVQHA